MHVTRVFSFVKYFAVTASLIININIMEYSIIHYTKVNGGSSVLLPDIG